MIVLLASIAHARITTCILQPLPLGDLMISCITIVDSNDEVRVFLRLLLLLDE